MAPLETSFIDKETMSINDHQFNNPYSRKENVVMDHQLPSQFPQLYSTSGHRSNSDSSEGGDREEYYNPEIVRPGDHVIPDLRHFVRTPKILTREGRDQLCNLRSNVGGHYGQRRAKR